MALGWSPAGAKSLTTSNGATVRTMSVVGLTRRQYDEVRTVSLARQVDRPPSTLGRLLVKVGSGWLGCAVVDSQAIFTAAGIERRAVADLLESLDERQLGTASLCAGWDVRTVAAHLAGAVAPSMRTFAIAVVRARGNLHRAIDAAAKRQAHQPVVDIVATLRRNADSHFAPPIVGARGPLTDVLVHAGDIRVPLGLGHDPDVAHVRPALDFVTRGRPIGFVPRGRLIGVRMIAEDMDWAWGSGATVRGRGIALLMAACGRAVVLDRLDGPGVALLANQLGVHRAGSGPAFP